EIDRLGNDAKSGKSKLDDLQGSTFTITSLGAEGGYFATPILNFPEVGILGVHRIKERPVVKDGQIVIGNVMLLSLSFDHRIVDGLAAGVQGLLEAPCQGNGPAMARFGIDTTFTGAVEGGTFHLEREWTQPIGDGCEWRFAETIAGTLQQLKVVYRERITQSG